MEQLLQPPTTLRIFTISISDSILQLTAAADINDINVVNLIRNLITSLHKNKIQGKVIFK